MESRVALVTGANKGIGKVVVRQLCAAGMVALVGARDPERGRAAADELGTRYVRLDVTDEDSVAAAATWIEREYGRLDVLVNNAAITAEHAAPSGTPLADVRRVFETNVFGVVAVTNAMLPLLRRSPAGRIVNVSSGLGTVAFLTNPDSQFYAEYATLLPYNASKAALNAVTLIYARELAGTPIKVNAASPGFVATDLNGFRGHRAEPTDGPFLAATLPDDGPTGTFIDVDGPIPW